MTKVTILDSQYEPKIKKMSEMEPGEICQIYDGEFQGHYVMRTLKDNAEIIDLTVFEPGEYWDSCWIKVTPCIPGTKIIFEVE